MFDKALLNLRVHVNMLPYYVYKQLGLGQLHSISIILQLTDRSIKISCGIIEDVFMQIDKFYSSIDFIVIDTQLVQNHTKHTLVILSCPFWVIVDDYISCRTRNMQLSIGNTGMKLNIFNVLKQAQEDDEVLK